MKSEKDKIPWSRLFVESKKQTKWDENRLIDTENKYGRGVEVAGEIMKEIWKYKPPTIRLLKNKSWDVMYNIGRWSIIL